MKVKFTDGKLSIELTEQEKEASHVVHDLAKDIGQCLYDNAGMPVAIVTCIAIMAFLLRARHAGDEAEFRTAVDRIAASLKAAPEVFENELQLKPDKPN